jgi:zinc/manganese transport system permease protein
MNVIDLMAAPLVECLVLVAIHTYLGIHVLKRRVVFVDLALAQIAALGTTVALFSITRFKNERVPQEAIIGLTYAISCAIAVLVIEKTKGAEHLKDILFGNLLWVTWSDVASAAAIYSIVGLVHFRFRKQFLLISNNPEIAFRSGVALRAWDFLFYLTFGVVITLSTRVAGVLLVFVFLVAPAVLAFLLTDRIALQLLIGWATGTAVTVVGLYLSWVIDLPSSPTVIALYGVTLIFATIVVFLIRAQSRPKALIQVALGTTGAVIIGFTLWGGGQWIASTGMALNDQARQEQSEFEKQRQAVDARASEDLKRRRAELTSRVSNCVGRNEIDTYLSAGDVEERFSIIRDRLRASKKKGLQLLLIALSDDALPLLYREESASLLVASLGESFTYDIQQNASKNTHALGLICRAIAKYTTGNEGGQ